MRKPMIAGNWKLHKTLEESSQLAAELVQQLSTINDRDIVIAPVFTALASVSKKITNSPIQLAAQNCYPAETGAFTGEVSPALLGDAGCHYIISGHSERRQLLNETNQFINQKVSATINAGLGAILCIGETLHERETHQMLEVLTSQIKEGLAGISTTQMTRVVIAYEPVWAIGTGVTAGDEQAQEAHAFIRGLLQGLYSQEVAEATRILYGGSVKPNNVDGLMAQTDIDGALVGGASLKAEDFIRIVKFES
ncbi:triose-phosphate isomerase [Pelovirga terrestris]|uniref:Triosephosphate isomerase n=1 Tax=Pelovirga terrestris TaxID=2771352 RepID=A0A8J6UG43_9BACT|nr:triose-phosphate isomerase [Pelovirga terrestris]MBD1399118.1 triose-phosphate isomerase [Pelovirga terrestris]